MRAQGWKINLPENTHQVRGKGGRKVRVRYLSNIAHFPLYRTTSPVSISLTNYLHFLSGVCYISYILHDPSIWYI